MRPEDLASPRGSTNHHPTFVAALRHDRITAPFVIDRAMTSAIFIEYVRQCLVSTLSPGDIVVWATSCAWLEWDVPAGLSARRHRLDADADCGGSSFRGGLGTRGCLGHPGGHMNDPRD